MAIFFKFWLLKMCWNTYFYSVFWKTTKICQKMAQKMAQKNDNFWHFAKDRPMKKKTFFCNPPFHQKLVFFKLAFLKPKTIMLNRKHNVKSGNSKDKKRDLKEKTRQETKKEKSLMKKMCTWIVWCCSCHETKAKKKEKMKKRQKQGTKRKQKRKARRKKERKERKEEKRERERERERKRNRKRGGQKRLREKERETLKINKKCPFLGEKQGFFSIKKQRKERKQKTKKQKKQKTKKTKKKTQEKKEEPKKQQKYQKIAFNYQSIFSFFLAGFSKFPFLTPWPKNRAPKKHYKIGVSGTFFLKSRCASRNGHFWTKKTKIHKFQLSFV